MLKKILAWCVLALLIAGTITGVVFMIKYYTEDKQYDDDVAYIQTLETRVDTLIDERTELLLEIAQLEEDNAYTQQLREQVANLTAQIESLQEEIAYKNQLLEAYENADKLIIEFYSNDKIHEILLVNSGETINENLIDAPTKTDHRFDGWAIEGTTEIVDFSSMTFTENTTFVAIFSPTKEVLFSGEEYISCDNIDSTKMEFAIAEYAKEILSLSINVIDKLCLTFYSQVEFQNGAVGIVHKSILVEGNYLEYLDFDNGEHIGDLSLSEDGYLCVETTEIIARVSFTIYEISKMI